MRRTAFISILVLLILSGLWKHRPWWIANFSLSTQRRIDPTILSENYDSNQHVAFFNNKKIEIPRYNYGIPVSQTGSVLGESSFIKRIEVDLSTQHLYAFEGGNQVYDFLISSGKWARTPTGEFRIWIKLKATKMEGGRRELGTYYYLPNVPYVMYFFNNQHPQWLGFGIHGTYWHSNFGHPMSHGCINMKTEDARLLYYWANPDLQGKNSIYASEDNPGTQVIIYGNAPLG